VFHRKVGGASVWILPATLSNAVLLLLFKPFKANWLAYVPPLISLSFFHAKCLCVPYNTYNSDCFSNSIHRLVFVVKHTLFSVWYEMDLYRKCRLILVFKHYDTHAVLTADSVNYYPELQLRSQVNGLAICVNYMRQLLNFNQMLKQVAFPFSLYDRPNL
jgi:hypothetical protein